ncbi:MAG: YraN family protein, partial [Crocinitomicaceae bacterium]|nr:YraN family protein [Crocinitomicaceae bacterium]
ELGELGEQLAVDFLVKKGHKLLDRNFKFKKLEIDIVTEFENKIIITEVKTRQNDYLTDPRELISQSKQKGIVKTANHYIQENEIDLEAQFDLIVIVFNQKQKEVRHMEDAFYPTL